MVFRFLTLTVAVTNPLASGIFYQHLQFFFSKYYLSALYWLMRITVVESGTFLSNLYTFIFSVLNFVFFTTWFSTKWFNFFKSIEKMFNLPASKSSSFVFKLFKLVGTSINLLMSSLSTSAFKATKTFLADKLDVPTLVACSSSF